MSAGTSYIVIFFAIVLRLIGGDVANISYFFLACYALFGRAQIIQSLALLWFFSAISPAIAPDASSASICRYITMLGAVISLSLHGWTYKGRLIASRSILTTLVFGLLIILHSILFSRMLEISILKILSWVTITVTLLSSWGGLDSKQRTQLEMQLFGGLALIMLASLPLVFADIGYLNNGIGFQGALNQSQTFGLAVVFLGSWLIGRLTYKSSRYHLLTIGLLGVCLVFAILSEARTAGFALVLALIGASSLLLPTLKITFKKIIWAFILASTISVIGVSQSDRLVGYIYKRDNAANLIEIFMQSRGILLNPMIENIVENPATGIGFGVASNISLSSVTRDGLFGLPISAPIEKGTLPVAVLEELGIFGFIAVVAWIWVISVFAVQAGFPQFFVLLTLLLTNLGESTLFSVGGIGLLLLILLTWSITARGVTWNAIGR